MDPGAIELSEKMYRLLSPLPEYPSYILRIENAADAKKYQADNYPPDKYPHITEFVCRNVPASAPIEAREKIRAEILLNNTLKTSSETIARYAGYTKVRVQGLDSIICDDYMRAFDYLKKTFNSSDSPERIEFCPRNHFNCATALAAEWITSGSGSNVVTSFGGIGGFAPTEELIMILREYRLRGENKIYTFFPEMTRLFHRLTKKNISLNKPIIGSRIFHVESGVHVDGIIKQPKCYEPFAPEIVGQKRKIVLGKHSGTASIMAKLSEFDIKCPQDNIPFILEQIKNKAVEENGEVSDWEFVRLLQKHLLKEQLAKERKA
jgi:homocitrate synthase NifV